MANNEQKSILEVFGEKSKDGDDIQNLLNSFLINYALSDEYGAYDTKPGRAMRATGNLHEMMFQALTGKSGSEGDYPYGEVTQFKSGQEGEYEGLRPSNINDLVKFIEEYQQGQKDKFYPSVPLKMPVITSK